MTLDLTMVINYRVLPSGLLQLNICCWLNLENNLLIKLFHPFLAIFKFALRDTRIGDGGKSSCQTENVVLQCSWVEFIADKMKCLEILLFAPARKK